MGIVGIAHHPDIARDRKTSLVPHPFALFAKGWESMIFGTAIEGTAARI
jgi:hypothetical protein